METLDEVDEALVEYEVARCQPDQLEAMWRSLCARMLYQTLLVRTRTLDSNEDAYVKRASRDWLTGGGIVTFEEACEAAGISPEKFRAFWNDQKRPLPPINEARRPCHEHARGPAQDPRGVVALSGAVAAGGRSAPRPGAGRNVHRLPAFSGLEDGCRRRRPAG